MRVKILKYCDYGRYFDCMLDEPIRRNGTWVHDSDYEIKIDDFEVGLAFFPDENHYVTMEEYQGLVGREFDIEKVRVHTYRGSKEDIKIVPPESNKWDQRDQLCGRCASDLCECGEFITVADWNLEQDRERLRQEAEQREYEERMAPVREQDRIDKVYTEFVTKHMNKKAMG